MSDTPPAAAAPATRATAPHPAAARPIPSPHAAWRSDLERYLPGEPPWPLWTRLATVVRRPQLWAITLFRLESYARSGAPAPLAAVLRPLVAVASAIVNTLLDVHLRGDAQIGPGLYIGHIGGVWVNARARLGACCTLSQGAVIGAAGGADPPQVGDRVWIGPHAVITGPIRVGSDAVIAANSLVAADVPPRAVVVGVPAKVLAYSGSAHLIRVPPSLRDG